MDACEYDDPNNEAQIPCSVIFTKTYHRKTMPVEEVGLKRVYGSLISAVTQFAHNTLKAATCKSRNTGLEGRTESRS